MKNKIKKLCLAVSFTLLSCAYVSHATHAETSPIKVKTPKDDTSEQERKKRKNKNNKHPNITTPH